MNQASSLPRLMELMEEIAVVREQLTVATNRAQRFRDCLMRLAARAGDYSGADVRAHVADALEITVKELEARLEAS